MLSLTRLTPFHGTAFAPFRDFEKLFPEAFADHGLAPAADVVETAEGVRVKIDLPGHDPASIQVNLEGDTLTIQSERKAETEQKGETWRSTERRFGSFARSFVLSGTLDGSRTEAKFENGVLTVTVPKKEEAKPRTISVKVEK